MINRQIIIGNTFENQPLKKWNSIFVLYGNNRFQSFNSRKTSIKKMYINRCVLMLSVEPNKCSMKQLFRLWISICLRNVENVYERAVVVDASYSVPLLFFFPLYAPLSGCQSTIIQMNCR